MGQIFINTISFSAFLLVLFSCNDPKDKLHATVKNDFSDPNLKMLLGKWYLENYRKEVMEIDDKNRVRNFSPDKKTAHYLFSYKDLENNASDTSKGDSTMYLQITDADSRKYNYEITRLDSEYLIMMCLSGAHMEIVTYRRWHDYEQATIKEAKCYLYKDTTENAITKGYLVQGDRVSIVENRGKWLKIEYYSASAKDTYVRWIRSGSNE